MLLAVNFHYIRPEGQYPFPGIFPTPPEALQAQLDELGRDFEFISGNDLLGALRDGRGLPELACLITFDDGLREQYEAAAPILEQAGVSGVFFVCTQPVNEGVGLAVHKMHRLRATRSPEAFFEQAVRTAERLGINLDLNLVDDEKANEQYLYDDPPTRRIKYLFNHILDFDDFRRLISAMFQVEMDERPFCEEMYMDKKQIHDLASRHTVGSHSHFHGPLASLAGDELWGSLRRSRLVLEGITGREVRLVSYPYGGPTAVSRRVAQAAKDVGFSAGFTMERSLNQALSDPHLLARVSTNDAPGGKTPLLVRTSEDGAFEARAPMTWRRRLYIDEALPSGAGVCADGGEAADG
jgi:peptidoglycan/xylan/chitin deacetylase (PgdA/CDA1 family)